MHARLIVDAVDALPEAVADVHADAVEHVLVGHAGSLDPCRLQTVARRVIDTPDPTAPWLRTGTTNAGGT